MKLDIFEKYTIEQITGIICGIRDQLCAAELLKDTHGAKAIIIDVCDAAKDKVQQPWAERAARATSNGRVK